MDFVPPVTLEPGLKSTYTRVRKTGATSHFTLHDLRRTARTHLAALGIRREVAERCLGHKLRGVEGTYDRHDYFKERRAALAQWAELLLDAERGERKVAPLRRRQLAGQP